MKVYELLDSPEKWTKGAYARDKFEKACGEDSEEAVSWCLLGAIRRCYYFPLMEGFDIVKELQESKHFRLSPESQARVEKASSTLHDCIQTVILHKGVRSIMDWNDSSATYEDVIRVCKELDI